jgi:phage baseplate assembly protein W
MAFQAGTPGAIKAVPVQAGHFGQGVKYPLAIDAAGRLALSAGPVAVADALSSIVQTQSGERAMQPDYGAGISLFDPIDPDRTRFALLQTIADHEPRIQTADVVVTQGQAASDSEATITYVLTTEANTRTLTVPFFVGPATTAASSA